MQRIQIFPMSKDMLPKADGATVDVTSFFREHVAKQGKPHHPTAGRFNFLTMRPKPPAQGETVVLLFQYEGNLVAQGVYLSLRLRGPGVPDLPEPCQGYLQLDPATVRAYGSPVSAPDISTLWPRLRLGNVMTKFGGDASTAQRLLAFLSNK